jgi:hypothetical protein
MYNYNKIKWMPIALIQGYLWITFALFWTTNLPVEITNLLELTVYVTFAYTALFLGYASYSQRKYLPAQESRQFKLYGNQNSIIFLAAIHAIIYSLVLMYEFDCLSFTAMYSAIKNPGAAYAAKFQIYEMQVDTGRTNNLMRLATLVYSLHYLGFLCFVYCWNDLKKSIRIAYIVSIILYVVAFMGIGTNKGLGDVVMLLGVGLVVRYAAKKLNTGTTHEGKYQMPSRWWVIIGFISFLVYFSNNQMSRGEQFGVSEKNIDVAASSLWGSFLNPDMAVIVNTIASYPSHGYAGLSYSLQQEFVFCNGYGISPALHSYANQYFSQQDMFPKTYPARSELHTGWPAKMYWSTAFVWWASDLTFPGTILLMWLIGRLLAWAWRATLINNDFLGVIVLGLLSEVCFYLTANNQVLSARTGLWATLDVLILLAWRHWNRSYSWRYYHSSKHI